MHLAGKIPPASRCSYKTPAALPLLYETTAGHLPPSHSPYSPQCNRVESPPIETCFLEVPEEHQYPQPHTHIHTRTTAPPINRLVSSHRHRTHRAWRGVHSLGRKTQDTGCKTQDARRKTQDAGRTKLIIHKNWTKWDKRLTTNVQRTTDNG